jgi:hypothetical protein
MRSRLATPAAMTAAGRPAFRFAMPRGLLVGTLVATALAWGPYAIDPKGRPVAALVQSGIYAGLLVLTVCSRRAKVLLIRTVQR